MIPYHKRPDESPEEQLETVKRMKKRDPKLMFDICPLCNTWAVVFQGLNGMHPLCWEKHTTKRKRVVDKNQGTFI